MDPILLIIIALILVTIVILIVIGLRSPNSTDVIEKRLAEFISSGQSATLEEIELSQPFVERVVNPIARKMGEFALRFAPQNAIQSVSRKLDMAGNPGNLDPTIFFSLRFLGLPLGALLLLLGYVAPKPNFINDHQLWIFIPATILGYYLPDLILKARIDRYQDLVRKSMPDALDLLTICVEAGLGFDAAMSKVSEKWDDEMGKAFGRVVREIGLGKLRRDALRDMSDRVGIPEMTSFVAAVIQSEQLGVPMAQVLRIQSDQMRIVRRQRAEEKAHQAPVKMVFPMGIFIFPALCIVMMGPAIMSLIETFGK
jgi:tight adherence protein C